MDTNNKFSKFVAKIEQDMLDGNKESMILHNNSMSNYFGGANGSCTNEASSCDGTTNNKALYNSGLSFSLKVFTTFAFWVFISRFSTKNSLLHKAPNRCIKLL